MTETSLIRILQDIANEHKRQDEKWGKDRNHDPFVWLVILAEEVGEFAEAALHHKFGGPKAINLRQEIIHVAAVAIQIIECLDRHIWSWHD